MYNAVLSKGLTFWNEINSSNTNSQTSLSKTFTILIICGSNVYLPKDLETPKAATSLEFSPIAFLPYTIQLLLFEHWQLNN